MNTSIAANKELVSSYFNAMSGQPKTPELTARFVSDENLLQHIREAEAAFPGYELVPEQMIAEGDLVVVRATFRGTQRGEFAGVLPTGKAVAAGLIIVYRIADGRIAEHWMQFDLFGLVQQLRHDSAPVVA